MRSQRVKKLSLVLGAAYALSYCGGVAKSTLNTSGARIDIAEGSTTINPSDTTEAKSGEDISIVVTPNTFSKTVQLVFIDPQTYAGNNEIPSYLNAVAFTFFEEGGNEQVATAKKPFQVCMRFKISGDLSGVLGKALTIKSSGSLELKKEIANSEMSMFKSRGAEKSQACISSSETSAFILYYAKDSTLEVVSEKETSTIAVSQEQNEIIVDTNSIEDIIANSGDPNAAKFDFNGKVVIDDTLEESVINFPIKLFVDKVELQGKESLGFSLVGNDPTDEITYTLHNTTNGKTLILKEKYVKGSVSSIYANPEIEGSPFEFGSNILEFYMEGPESVMKRRIEITITNFEVVSSDSPAKTSIDDTTGAVLSSWLSPSNNDNLISENGEILELSFGSMVR